MHYHLAAICYRFEPMTAQRRTLCQILLMVCTIKKASQTKFSTQVSDMVSVHTEHCIDYHMNKCSFEAFSLHWCKTSVLHGHKMIVFIQCILLRTTTPPNSPKALPYLFRTTARFSTQVGDMLASNLLNTQFDCTICAFNMLLEHQEKNRVTER